MEVGERKSFHPISVIAVDPVAVSIRHYSKEGTDIHHASSRERVESETDKDLYKHTSRRNT